MHRLRPCDVRWRRFFVCYCYCREGDGWVCLDDGMDGLAWCGWGRKVRYPGEGTMGVIGIMSSSLFLRLWLCDFIVEIERLV